MIDILGKNVRVNVKKVIKSSLQENRTTGIKIGKVLDEKDWLIGCSLFVEDETGDKYAVGYECEVIEIINS